MVAPAFRGADLREKFLPVVERNARRFIDAFRHTGEADLVEAFATRFAEGFGPVETGVCTRGPASLPVRFTPAGV